MSDTCSQESVCCQNNAFVSFTSQTYSHVVRTIGRTEFYNARCMELVIETDVMMYRNIEWTHIHWMFPHQPQPLTD